MHWLFWKHRHVDNSEQLKGDRKLRAEKEAGLAKTEEQWPEVNKIVSELARHRRANQFGERIMKAVKGT